MNGCRASVSSSRMCPLASYLAEQVQNLDVHPHERYHDPKGVVPFHVLGGTRANARLYEIEIQNQVQCRHDYDKYADCDSPRSRDT